MAEGESHPVPVIPIARIPITHNPPVGKFVHSDTKSTPPKSDTEEKQKLLQLPVTRVRSVMKCAPEVTNINQESVVVMTKAAVRTRINTNLIYSTPTYLYNSVTVSKSGDIGINVYQ